MSKQGPAKCGPLRYDWREEMSMSKQPDPARSGGQVRIWRIQPFTLPLLGVIPVPFKLTTADKNSANWTAEQVASHMAAQRRLGALMAGINSYLRERGLIS